MCPLENGAKTRYIAKIGHLPRDLSEEGSSEFLRFLSSQISEVHTRDELSHLIPTGRTRHIDASLVFWFSDLD
jgi:hypothetical protein